MTAAPLPLDELRALADAACKGNLSPSEAARLEALLRGSTAVATILFGLRPARRLSEMGVRQPGPGRTGRREARGAGGREAGGGDAGRNQKVRSTEYGVPSRNRHDPTSHSTTRRSYSVLRTRYFSRSLIGYPSSVALHSSSFSGAHDALLRRRRADPRPRRSGGVGMGHPRARGPAPEVAVTSPAAPPSREMSPGGKMERPCLGKIVPLTKCTWRGSQTLDSCCEMGCIELVSGSLEVTYRTGTKVVIEGPALYIAESLNGGYLGVGKIKVVCPARLPGRGIGNRSPPQTSRSIERRSRRCLSCTRPM